MTKMIDENWDKRSLQFKKRYKLAEDVADFQESGRKFFDGKSKSTAEAVIAKGNEVLEQSNQLGLFMMPRESIRHRIIVAERYIIDNPGESYKKNVKTIDLKKWKNKKVDPKKYCNWDRLEY